MPDSPADLWHQQRGMHLVQRQAEKAQHGVHQSQQVCISITTGMNPVFHFQPTPFLFNITHLKLGVDITRVLVILYQPRSTVTSPGHIPRQEEKHQQLFRKMFQPAFRASDHLLKSFSTESSLVLGGYHHISNMEAEDRDKSKATFLSDVN